MVPDGQLIVKCFRSDSQITHGNAHVDAHTDKNTCSVQTDPPPTLLTQYLAHQLQLSMKRN